MRFIKILKVIEIVLDLAVPTICGLSNKRLAYKTERFISFYSLYFDIDIGCMIKTNKEIELVG